MTNTVLGEIVLLSGEQAGARARLRPNSTMSISGELGTDIYIRDKYINDGKLKLITNNDKVFLQIVAGEIEIDGQIISKNNTVQLMEDTKVKVGKTIFVHQNIINTPLSEIEKKVNINQVRLRETDNCSNKKGLLQRILVLGSSVVMVLISVTVMTTMMFGKNTSQLIISEEMQALSLLKSNGYEDLEVAKNNNDQIVVSGYVLTNKDLAKIEKIIDEESFPVIYDIKVGDQLAKEVSELYRINGVNIEATAIDKGIVHVKAEDKYLEMVTRIKEVALNEIDALKSLDIEYVISDVDEQTIGEELRYDEKDKRITMVVDGDPAYIMTSDNAKYYVGALLPEGYKVIDIVEKQVVLERHGRMTTLNF